MGNVVNMFELPDSAVLTTAQKAIEVVKKQIKENSVLTFQKLGVVHNITTPRMMGGSSHTHRFCDNCGGIFPDTLGAGTECPHCGVDNKKVHPWARVSSVYNTGHMILFAANGSKCGEAKPAPALVAAA